MLMAHPSKSVSKKAAEAARPARKLIRHVEPSELPADADVKEARLEFGRRLSDLMDRKGFNQSETARRAEQYMPIDDETGKPMKFGRDLISHYVRGRNFPTSAHTEALCKIFGVTREYLIPSRGVQRPMPISAMQVSDHDGATAWVRINQRLPWDIALKIQELVHKNKVSE